MKKAGVKRIFLKKAQAGLETIISLALVTLLLLGMTRTFVWFNQCMVERQRAYDGTREIAGGNWTTGNEMFGGRDYITIGIGELTGTMRLYFPVQTLLFLDPYNRTTRYKAPDAEMIAYLLANGLNFTSVEDILAFLIAYRQYSYWTRPPDLITLERKGALGNPIGKAIW